jgi:tRNA threonylcarbamoyladenosine biosynthesis protein TsaE
MKNVFKSYSSRETAEFGSELAKKLSLLKKNNHKTALIIALSGDLGAGKTTFTQGFAKGLSIKRRIASPTFVLLRRFSLRHQFFVDFYHIDAYRIKETDTLEAIGLGGIISNPQNIVLIEWPEKIKRILPKTTVWLKFQHGKKENERTILYG